MSDTSAQALIIIIFFKKKEEEEGQILPITQHGAYMRGLARVRVRACALMLPRGGKAVIKLEIDLTHCKTYHKSIT
jgi:hypothetical protein